jgi:5-methylcytosine-specific restriction endonuclease McrA
MSSTTRVTSAVALRILEQQQYRCALTGRELTPETAVLDHIVPLGRGGAHAASNIWVLHRDVNQAKGKMLPEEFFELCQQVMANKAVADRLVREAAADWHQSPLQ